ncbi:MAG: hypothetical protein HC905_17190 [Bacteroidales bacterium]|nr:hypothetical protein [Bacteroidales bacterium]
MTSICESNSGELWITSAGSGAVLLSNPEDRTENFKYKRFEGNQLSDLVFSSYKMRDGNIMFITDVGIRMYNAKKKSFENFSPRLMPRYFQITSMCEDLKGNIWFGTHHGGVYQYLPKEDTVKIYDIRDGLSSNWIACFCPDRKGNIWIGTWGGRHYCN